MRGRNTAETKICVDEKLPRRKNAKAKNRIDEKMHERKKVQTKIYPDKKIPRRKSARRKIAGRKNAGRKSADEKNVTKKCQRKNGPDTLPGWEKFLGLFFNKYLFGLYQAALELWKLKSAVFRYSITQTKCLLVLIHFDLQHFVILFPCFFLKFTQGFLEKESCSKANINLLYLPLNFCAHSWTTIFCTLY